MHSCQILNVDHTKESTPDSYQLTSGQCSCHRCRNNAGDIFANQWLIFPVNFSPISPISPSMAIITEKKPMLKLKNLCINSDHEFIICWSPA